MLNREQLMIGWYLMQRARWKSTFRIGLNWILSNHPSPAAPLSFVLLSVQQRLRPELEGAESIGVGIIANCLDLMSWVSVASSTVRNVPVWRF